MHRATASLQDEPGYGALVISLDFELHWGVHDVTPADGDYRANLIGAREAVPRMLDLFEEFDAGVTWATVGFLFAGTREELQRYSPIRRPLYRARQLDPYPKPLGQDESEDPVHYAPSLIREVLSRKRQEMATHTYSHYYCLEDGPTPGDFRADLESACRIAANYGVKYKSIVFPRNQYSPEFLAVLPEFGITNYRGTESHPMYSGGARQQARKPWRRVARILDTYANLSGANIARWRDIPQPDGLFNIPSSRFLRAYSPSLRAAEPLRLRRILGALEEAARERGLFHLNWHPHNFGVNLDENLAVLRAILERYRRLSESHGMRALSMHEVAETLRSTQISACAGEGR